MSLSFHQPYKARRGASLMINKTKINKPVTRGLRPSYAEEESVSFTTATSSIQSSDDEESVNDEDDVEVEEEEEEESDYSGCIGPRGKRIPTEPASKRRKASNSHPHPRHPSNKVNETKPLKPLKPQVNKRGDPSPEAVTHKVTAPSKHLVSSQALTIMEELALKLAHPPCGPMKQTSSRARGGLLLPPCIPSIQHDAFSIDPSSAPLLGHGNYGAVYEGVYQGRKVAVKVQSLNEQDQDDFHELSTEALFGACLSHPGLLKTEASSFINREIYLVTEIMDQGSVLKAFNGKSLASSLNLLVALSVAEQVAWALDYLHSLDLVHLDVKGANILIDGNSRESKGVRAVLCDFGLMMRVKDVKQQMSRRSASSSFNIRDRGTIRYMGPEYYDEGSVIGHASDVYAFGCVLFEMATGRPFLGDKSDKAVVKMKGKVDVPWSTGGSPSLEAFLKLSAQCRAAKPSSRPDARSVALTLKSMAAKLTQR